MSRLVCIAFVANLLCVACARPQPEFYAFEPAQAPAAMATSPTPVP